MTTSGQSGSITATQIQLPSSSVGQSANNPGVAVPGEGSAVRFLRNVTLPDSPNFQMSAVNSPSVATLGAQVYFVGNRYAARSLDDGATWHYFDPSQIFPASASGAPFYGDQMVISDPSRNLTIWVLEYRSQAGNDGTLRIAVKSGQGGAPFDSYIDVLPSTLNSPFSNALRFGRNNLVLTATYLYLTANVSGASATLRIPLDSLVPPANPGSPRTAVSCDVLITPEPNLRATAGARGVMYFGSNANPQSVRVYTWPEANGSLNATYQDVTLQSGWGRGPYTTPLPNAGNWLANIDDRISAALFSKAPPSANTPSTSTGLPNGTIGFLWTASAQGAQRPYPYIRAVCINVNAGTMTWASEPDLFDANTAYAYPDACPNAAGMVGIAFFRGGGRHFPSPMVGTAAAVVPGVTNNNGAYWSSVVAKRGTAGTPDGRWGDYVTCRSHAGDAGMSWAAAGYTAAAPAAGSTAVSIQPHYVRFAASAAVNITAGALVTIQSAMPGGKYLSMGSGYVTSRTSPGQSERFTLGPQDDGTVTIQSVAIPNQYMGMDGRNVTASYRGRVFSRSGHATWERFWLRQQPDGTFAIEARDFPGVYLSMGADPYAYDPDFPPIPGLDERPAAEVENAAEVRDGFGAPSVFCIALLGNEQKFIINFL